MQASPTFMKSQGPLTIALSLSLAATSLMAADAPKKKPAAATPAAKPATKPDAKPDAAKPDDATAAKGTALPDPVAIVDGDPVKKSELEEAFANVLRARQIPADSIPEEERAEGYRMILDEIILDKLLVKLSAGTKVTDEEVAAKFENHQGPVRLRGGVEQAARGGGRNGRHGEKGHRRATPPGALAGRADQGQGGGDRCRSEGFLR